MKVLISERISQHKFKTSEGYLICVDSVLARTGKQLYRKNEVFATDEDVEIEIDRRPEEVFSDATLSSFENKPLTLEHPERDVNISNFKELSVGFVRDIKSGTESGEPVMLGTLVITDEQAIADVESGKYTDLSCGYDCDIKDEANPQQRNIRGNHVALCEQGRAGIARIVDSVKDSSDEHLFVIGWVRRSSDKEESDDVYASNKQEAMAKLRKRYGKEVYQIFECRMIESEKKEMIDATSKFVIINGKDEFLSIGAKSWVTEESSKIKTFTSSDEAWEYVKQNANGKNIRVIKLDDSVKDSKLPRAERNKISNYLSMISTFTTRDIDITDIIRPLQGKGYKVTREKIDGWNKMSDGMMRKDYYFSIDGYDDKFMVSLYAKEGIFKVTEVNAYFNDSINDSVKDEQLLYPNGTAVNMDYLKKVKETAKTIRYKNLMWTDRNKMYIDVDKATGKATYNSGAHAGTMKFNDSEHAEDIVKAIADEKEAISHYDLMLESDLDEASRAIIEEIRDDEKEHLELLLKMNKSTTDSTSTYTVELYKTHFAEPLRKRFTNYEEAMQYAKSEQKNHQEIMILVSSANGPSVINSYDEGRWYKDSTKDSYSKIKKALGAIKQISAMRNK